MELYSQRLAQQLDRQTLLVSRLTDRMALLQAELGILSAAAAAVRVGEPGDMVLRDLLENCLNACGFSRGAVYLEAKDRRLVLTAQFGNDGRAEGRLSSFFGHAELLREGLQGDSPMLLPGPGLPAPEAEAILHEAGMKSIVLAPIRLGGRRMGAFWMGSDHHLVEADVRPFAEAISAQLAQAVALTRAFDTVTAAEREYREIFENSIDGIFQIGLENRIVNANPALARIMGYDSVGELMAAAPRLPDMLVDPVRAAELNRCLREAQGVVGFEAALRGKDGVNVWFSMNGRAIRDGGGALLNYLGSLRDITDKVRAREQNRQEETRRQQLQIKDQFLSLVSHELRSPVAAIHQFVTILLDGLAGDVSPEQREHLSVVLRNVNELRALIEGLLEATRVDKPSLAILPGRVVMAQSISEAIGVLEMNARAKGVTLRQDLPADLPSVRADASRVGQILTNLIGNAIKFTPAGGAVTVRARCLATRPRAVRVEVADTGTGIPSEETGKIFDYLYQGSNIQEQNRKGFGIGLHICKDLVERQGGTIGVESAIGRGSTFFFTLPSDEEAAMESTL